MIAVGVDAELDGLRELRDGGRDAIAKIQADERARTGIPSLKVGFNKVFGYYIEVTRSNLHLVPTDYQRRQTITSGERFVTPALKEHEERVLTAAERIESRERELFDALRAEAGARDRPAAADRAHGGRARCAGDARRRRGARRVREAGDLRLFRARDRGGAPSGRRADDAARQVHSERSTTRRGCARHHPDRPEHGGQIDGAPPDRA